MTHIKPTIQEMGIKYYIIFDPEKEPKMFKNIHWAKIYFWFKYKLPELKNKVLKAYYRQRVLFIERKHDRIVRRAKYKFYKSSKYRSKFFMMKEMLERGGY